MKRRIAFTLLSVAVLGGATSCFTWGQDPFGPARAPRATTIRTDRAETVNVSGADLAAVSTWVVESNTVDQKVDKLIYELKSAEGAKKETLVTQLAEAVGEQFDRRQESKAKELKALEEQVIRLKELHAKRTQQRSRIIADRVNQILLEGEGLGWGTEVSDATNVSGFFGKGVSPSNFGRTLRATTSDPLLIGPTTTSPIAPNAATAPAADRSR